MAASDNTLKIGDFISLKILVYNSYLSAEGILVEDVYAQDGTESFEDHIFQVYIQMQYSASNEYDEFKNNFDGDISTVHETGTLKHIQSLKRGKENEGLLNDMFFAQKSGNEVSFGDVIQLRHVRSGKFLTVLPNELAKEERENARVGLSADGNVYSWLKITPRFKIDRIGSAIASGTEALLQVVERNTEYIHCTDKLSILGKTREINSAMENGTSFRLSVYQRVSDVCRDNFLLSGQLICISDPETKSYLTVFQTPPEIEPPADPVSNKLLEDGSVVSSLDGEDVASNVKDKDKEDDEKSVSSMDEYLNEYGDIVLQPVKMDNFDSNAIWILETPSIFNAGPISWKTDKLLIRHLNTGKYLTVKINHNHVGEAPHHHHITDEGEGDHLVAKPHHTYPHGYGGGGHAGNHAVLSLTEDVNPSMEAHSKQPVTLFGLHQVHSGGSLLLENAKALSISTYNNKIFIAREEFHDQYKVYPCRCVKTKGKAVSLVIKRYEGTGGSSSISAKKPADAPSATELSADVDSKNMSSAATTKRGCLDIYVGLSCKKAITNCLSVIQVPASQDDINSMNTLFPSESVQQAAETLSAFLYTMNCIVMYVNGFPIANSDISKAKADVDARKVRQNMFREQGTMEMLLRLLNVLIPISTMSCGGNFEDTTGVLAIGKSVVAICLKLLLRTISDHPENQMYAADYLTILLAHVGSDMTAAACISEMLSVNLELQELKISVKEIEVFISRLRESDMNPMFLVLLQACSSCKGYGNMKNQNVVSNAVYTRGVNDIVFEIKADYKTIQKVDWVSGNAASVNLYVPNQLKIKDKTPGGTIAGRHDRHGDQHSDSGSDAGSTTPRPSAVPLSAVDGAGSDDIACIELYKTGLPLLQCNWTWSGNKIYNPVFLFGTEDVNIVDIFRAGSGGAAGNYDAYSAGEMVPGGGPKSSGGSNKASPSKLSNAAMIKNKIAIKNTVSEFLIGQLFLAAELCLDRNYTVISMLEKKYPLDILVSMIKYNCSNLLKGAAARLIMTLHVDRHPQLSVTLPRLTRTYTQVETVARVMSSSGTSGPILDIEMKHPNSFMLIQLLIADNLRQIKGRSFGNYAVYIIELLQYLIRFNFYNSIDQLKDVIGPVMDALNRRNIDYEQSDVSGSLVQRRMSVKSKAGKGKSKSQRVAEAAAAASKQVDMDNSGLDSNDNSGLLDFSAGKVDDSGSLSGVKGSEEEEDRVLYPDSWQAETFIKMESIEAVVVILAFTFISVGVALYQFLTNKGNGLAWDLFSYFITGVFTVDYFGRMYCYHYSRGGHVINFMKKPLNIIDAIVVALDYIIYSAGPLLGSASGFTKTLRLLRLARLARIAKTARLVEVVASTVGIKLYPDFSEPDRYIKTSNSEMATLVKLVDVLSTVQQYVDDRNISLLLDVFHQWCSGQTNKTPSELFEIVANTRCTELRVSNDAYDDVLLDVMLYHHYPLTQSVLDVLMKHHSSKLIMLHNMKNVQLLMTSHKEVQFKKIESIILALRRHADTQELWTKLLSDDHHNTNKETHKFLQELTNACRKRCKILVFDEEFEPETGVQDMLRNLGCFDICMRILRLLPNLDSGSSMSESTRNLRSLLTLCNGLLYWFVRSNPTNQLLAYDRLTIWMNSIDSRVNSHRCISAIFENNIYLMKLCPKVYISDFVNKILSIGRFPQYVTLLTSVTAVGNDSVVANQYEIVRLLSSPENAKRVTMYFCPKSHPDYQKKIKLMQPYLNKKDISMDDCPSDLAYHIELMAALTGCTVGRKNITTVEAKVQSLFHFVDVVEAMLDPNTLLFARIKLGMFFYNAMIDVEMKLPSLKDAACVWKLLSSFQEVFLLGKDDLRQIEKNGWEAPSSNRQKVEYMMCCAMIIKDYFSLYYDVSIYRQDILASHVKRVHMTENQGNALMSSLFVKLKLLYEMQSPLLGKEHQTILYDALVAINNVATSKFAAVVENIHEYKGFYETEMKSSENRYENKFEEFCALINADEGITQSANDELQTFISKVEKLPLEKDNTDADVRYESVMRKFVQHVMSGITVVLHGDETSKEMDSRSTKSASWILRMFTSMIENRWKMNVSERDEDGGEEEDELVADLMVTFIDIGVMPMCLSLMSKGIDPAVQLEAINLATAMLLKDGGAVDVQRVAHTYLSNRGSELFFEQARTMIQQLISWHESQGLIILEEGQDPELPKVVMLLRFLQLLSEGHFKDNQNVMREQPKCMSSINLLDDMVMYLACLDKIPCRTSTDGAIRISNLILEVIQGPCEMNQDYFALNTPLIETLNRNLRSQVSHDCIHSEQVELKKTTIDIFQALLEGQGSKKAVYERVLSVIHIDVVHMMSDPVKSSEEEAELKLGADGEDDDEEEDEDEFQKEKEKELKAEAEAEGIAEEDLELQTESLVLLQMLCNYKPSMREELELTDNIDNESGSSNQQVASIELVWRGELQRRFFRIPLCCRYLAKSTKDSFIDNVDRSSAENKLLALLSESKEMYREIQHQKRINSWGMNSLFSKTMQDRLTWFSFYIVCIINVVMMFTYESKVDLCPGVDATDPAVIACLATGKVRANVAASVTPVTNYGVLPLQVESEETFGERMLAEGDMLNIICNSATGAFCSYLTVSSDALLTIEVLRYFLLFLNICTVAMVMAVTVPVRLDRCKEQGQSTTMAFINSIMDPATLYYLFYLILVIFTTQSPIIYSFLLLDIIVKDQTTADVINSLWYPRKQLAVAFLLSYIVMFIFAVIFFLFYSDNANFTYKPNFNLWKMYKVLTIYAPDGNPSGIFNNNRGYRAFPDIMLYIIIFVLQEMAKGIVIDAFSTLRELKNSRVDDTENVCFICGIPKITFERQIDRAAFDSHVKNFHHLWNYLYFIIYLWEQDKDDDDGLEHDIRHCIENNDISWFPMNKAMQMQHVVVSGDTDTVEQKFYSELDGMESRFHSAVNGFSTYMSKNIERVTRIVESTHAMNAPKRTAGKSRPGTNAGSRPLTNMGGGVGGGNGAFSLPITRVSSALDQNAIMSRAGSGVVSVGSGVAVPRRPSFHPTLAFLEKEEYISLQIRSVSGLELSENQYTKVSCRMVTPKNTFDVTATDYTTTPLSNMGSATFEDSASVTGSLNGLNDDSVDIDDDLDAIEAYMKNIYATHNIDLSFIHKDRRDFILFKAADYKKELDKGGLKEGALRIPIAIQIVLNEDGKLPKLLGTLQFELMDLMRNFEMVRAEEKQLRQEELLRLQHTDTMQQNLSISTSNIQKDFPLNGHGTIRAKTSGIEIIEHLASGERIPIEMVFEQRNSQAKKCSLLAHLINHQQLI